MFHISLIVTTYFSWIRRKLLREEGYVSKGSKSLMGGSDFFSRFFFFFSFFLKLKLQFRFVRTKIARRGKKDTRGMHTIMNENRMLNEH